MTTLNYSIEIDAPIDLVWEVLTQFDRYGEWNRFTPKVETTGRLGDPVTLFVRLNEGEGKRLTRSKLTLKKRAAYELCWGAENFFIKANRYQTLTPLEGGKTLYQSREPFGGLLAPLIMWLHRDNLMRGYRWAAEGLKARAEQLAQHAAGA